MSQDLELLQGSWTLTALEVKGQRLSSTELPNGSMIIRADRFTINSSISRASKGTLKLQPSRSPRLITMKFDAGPQKGKSTHGIYELDGDTWKICLAIRGTVRPSTFASSSDSEFVFETFTRSGTSASADSTRTCDLFFGTLKDWERFEAQAKACVELVNSSTSIRLIVLETWLFVDYVVRELLMSGLQLERVDNENFDLRNVLLPRGFSECIRLLQKLRDVNQDLPEEPERPLTARSRKWVHFNQFDPGLTERIAAAESSYRETFGLGPRPLVVNQPVYRSVPNGWLEVASRVDESWVGRAKKLNSARNLAAHSREESNIAAKLALRGLEILKSVRVECLGLIEHLTGVSIHSDLQSDSH